MSATGKPDRDTALAMLAQACDQLGAPNGPSTQASPERPPVVETPLEPVAKVLPRRRWPGRTQTVVAVGLIFVVAGIALLSRQDHPAPSRASSSATEASAKPTLQKDVTGTIDTGRSQPSAQELAGSALASANVSKGPDSSQSFLELTRALGELRQEVVQLKSFQNQMSQNNAELTRRLTTTLDTAQRNADGAEELKSELVRKTDRLTEQLKANQEQMTSALLQLKSNQEQVANVTAQLKSAQDQIARLSEQKPRPKTIAVAGQPLVNRTPKPTSSLSAQPRLLPRNPTGQPPR